MDDNKSADIPQLLIYQIGSLHKKILKDCGKILRELEFPLEMDQIPVLMMLYYSNAASQQEISAGLQRDKASVNRTVTFLTKAGITEVAPYGDSKRKTSVRLTANGKKLAKQADIILNKFGEDFSVSLTKEERLQFNVILQKLMDTTAPV